MTGNGMIPRSGMPSTNTTAQNTNELNANLRKLNQTMCCIASGEGSSDYEYIPVYEYRQVQVPGISASSSDDLYYQISGTNFSIAWKSNINCTDFCGDFLLPPFQDSINNVIYRDSLGRFIESQSPISVSFTNFINKDIYATVTITLNSGFTFTTFFYILTNGTGQPTATERFYPKSNTNSNNQYVWVNLLSFKVPISELLEVRQNGTFVNYIDKDTHLPVVPTYCISYDPIPPFITFVEDILKPTYNACSHTLVSNSTLSILKNSVHSITYTVVSGSVDVTIDGVTTTLPAGISATIEATTLVNVAVSFTSSSTLNTVYVKTMKY